MPYVSADFTNVLGSFYAGMQIKMAHETHTRNMEKEDAATAFKSIGEWQNLYNAEVFDWAESKGMDMESFDYKKLSPAERAEYNSYINERYPGAAQNVQDLYNKYVTPTMKGSTKGPLQFIQSLINPDEFHLLGKSKDSGAIVPKTKNGTPEPDDPVLSLGINEIANRTRASLATKYGFNALTAQQVLEYASGDPKAATRSATASERTDAAGGSSNSTIGESAALSSGEGAASGDTPATNQAPAEAALAKMPSMQTEFAQRFEGVEEERLARALGNALDDIPTRETTEGTGYWSEFDQAYNSNAEDQRNNEKIIELGYAPPEIKVYDNYTQNGENGVSIGQDFAGNPFSVEEQRLANPVALAGTGDIRQTAIKQMPPPTYNDQLGRIPDSGIQTAEEFEKADRYQQTLEETYIPDPQQYADETNSAKWNRQIADVNTRLIQAKKDTKDAIADLANKRDPRERIRQQELIAEYQEKERNIESEYALAQQAKEEELTNQQAEYRAQNQARSAVENQARAEKAEEDRLIAKAEADKTATTTQNENGSTTTTSGESTRQNANGSTTTVPAGTFTTTTSDGITGTTADINKLSSVVASSMARGGDVNKVLREAVMELGPTGTTKAINDVLQEAAGGIPLDGTRSPLTGAFVAVRNPAKRRMVAGLMLDMGFFGAQGAEATSTAMTYMQTGMMPDQITQHWEMYTKAAEANQAIWAAKASRSEALTTAGKGIADAYYKQSMLELKQEENNIARLKVLADSADSDLKRRKLLAEAKGQELENKNKARLLDNATEQDQVAAEKQLESAMLNTTTDILRRIRGVPGVDVSNEFVRDSVNASISSVIANEKDVLVATGLQFMAKYGTDTDKAFAAEAQRAIKASGGQLRADIKLAIIRNTEKYNNLAAAALAPAAIMGEYVLNDNPRETFPMQDIFTYGENMGDAGTGRIWDIFRKIPNPFSNDDAQSVFRNIKSQVQGGAGMQSEMQYQYGLILQEQFKKRDKALGLDTRSYMQ